MNLAFSGDCCYTSQRHFVACLLSSEQFETNGPEYPKTLAVQEAVYASAEFLFDLESDAHERNNLIAEHPAKAVELRERLRAWCGELRPPGLPDTSGNLQEGPWYRHYFGLKDTPITH